MSERRPCSGFDFTDDIERHSFSVSGERFAVIIARFHSGDDVT
jgi:hypothetical protein